MRLGTWIAEERKRRQWTQDHLAHLAGVTQGAIGHLERGVRSKATTAALVQGIARAFGVTVEEMMAAASAGVAVGEPIPGDALELARLQVPPEIAEKLLHQRPRMTDQHWAEVLQFAADLADRADAERDLQRGAGGIGDQDRAIPPEQARSHRPRPALYPDAEPLPQQARGRQRGRTVWHV